MATYQSPGVYIEEQDRGTKPIEAVGTAVAAFIGYTEKAEETNDDGEMASLLDKAVPVTNWTQFVEKFGGFIEGAYLPYSVYGYFQNGGSRAYVVSVKTLAKAAEGEIASPATALLPSQAEAGTDTLQITAKEGGPLGNDIQVTVREEGGEEETFTMQVNGPETSETFPGLTLGKSDNNVETVVNTQSQLVNVEILKASGTLLERRPASGLYKLSGGEIETVPVSVTDYRGETAERTGLGGLEAVDEVTMVAVPDLMMSYQNEEMSLKDVQAVQQALYEHCERVKYAFAILDSPPDLRPSEVREWRMDANYDSKYAALYYRPRDTWPASMPAATQSAACTRPRPTRSCAAPPGCPSR